MSLAKIHARMIQAMLESEKMTADQFNHTVLVEHGDGSTFRCTYALFKQEGELSIIYYEHGHPMVFFTEDLKGPPQVMAHPQPPTALTKADLETGIKAVQAYLENSDPVEAASALDLLIQRGRFSALPIMLQKAIERAYDECQSGSPELMELRVASVVERMEEWNPLNVPV